MHYPQARLAQAVGLCRRAAAAEGYGSGNLLGIGIDEIHGAVAAKAHAKYIDARLVDGQVALSPFKQVVEFLGTPGSLRLRGYDDGRQRHAVSKGVDGAVAAHLLKVGATTRGAVKVEHERQGTAAIGVVFGRVEPEVIVVGQDLAVGGKGPVVRPSLC